MKLCRFCHTENEDDAIYCKKCANPLEEEQQEKNDKGKNKNKVKKEKKVKQKVKTKYKTKVERDRGSKEKQKSSFFSKFLVFVLLIIVIALACCLGVLGYHYYQENNIEVPNVLGYGYDEATAILSEAGLSYQEKEVLTEDSDEVGIVLKQSKRAGSKTHENAIITLTVGVLDTHVEVPDVRNMVLEDAINTLNHAGISYQLEYLESNKDENIVLKQSVRPGKEIDQSESIVLTVSVAKNHNQEEKPDEETISPSEDATTEDSDTENESSAQ